MNNDVIGKCIYLSNDLFRILYIDSLNAYLIQMDTKEVKIKPIEAQTIKNLNQMNALIDSQHHKIIDVNSLSEVERKRFETAKAIVTEITDIYAPSFIELVTKRKTGIIKTLSIKYGVSVKTIWKYIRKYLQSGFDDCSLIDGRRFNDAPSRSATSCRPGRKSKDQNASTVVFDESVRKNADKIIEMFLKTKGMTIKAAYELFINTFYSVYDAETNRYIWFPKNQIPTHKQFYDYLRKKTTKKQRDEKRSSKHEVENNCRNLTGTSRNSPRPGFVVECDALEVDVSLVSHLNAEQTVGRPIMYLMVDVLTSCIMAMSVSFENNSYIGLTNLFLNLCEDKVELCKKYGLQLDSAVWPSSVVPRELRCDRGSDFMSEDFKKVCNSLNINLNPLSPGMGSKKGIVEQCFHQFHEFIKPILADYGLITKRHDSKHHRQAMLTLSEFTKIALNYVIYHNQHIIENYMMTPEMLQDPNFKPKPYLLWQFYAAKTGCSTRILDHNRNNYLYSLLLDEKATVNKQGVRFKNLLYINDDAKLLAMMYCQGFTRKKIKIKYDPRNTSKIYYLDNNQVIELYLNSNIANNYAYKDMTWKEYEEYYEKNKEVDRDAKHSNIELNAQYRQINKSVVSGALNNVLPMTKNMKENRKNEKYAHNHANQIQFDFSDVHDEKDGIRVYDDEQMKASSKPADENQTDTVNRGECINFFIKQ